MVFTKRFDVSIKCVCGEKLDAYLSYEGESDFLIIVDNTHVCPAKMNELNANIKVSNEFACDCDLKSSEPSNRHEVFCSLYKNARLGDG